MTSVLASSMLAASAGIAMAQTADRQRIERADNHCAVYGPGFVPIAGTNTCVKIGGHVQVQLNTDRPIGFQRSSPLQTPQANLNGVYRFQGEGGTMPADLSIPGPAGD